MKQYLLLLFFYCLSFIVNAQTGKIYGSLKDTTNYKTMAYSSVTLLGNDSHLVQTKFTGQNGEFSLNNLKKGNYRLLITCPGYADYEEGMILDEGEQKNMGVLVLISRENLLKEILIKDRAAIKIKGDTTEFLVDSFLVNKNSNVEDLLKRLPGIQVDKAGKITAQGQEVKKVLVDGEEFFGSDPTVATKNLRADNVETVQVFDKKSEQTIQTGIDDGTKEKTINLTLKEDAKKGYFGKVGIGVGTKNDSKIEGVQASFGTENRYEGEAMYNNFKAKRKASVFSTFSNTNKTGLNWEDREKYMGGNNIEYDESSGYMYSFYEGDANGYNGNGIPQTTFIGGNFSDKIRNDKFSYNVTATNRQTLIQGIDKNFTQYILPDTMYFNTQVNKMNNKRQANNVTGKTEWKIDSLMSVVLKINVTQTLFDNENSFTSENFNGNAQKVNENARDNNNKGQNMVANYSVLFNKKFKKTGRSFTWQFDQKINRSNSDGNLLSKTTFYNGDSSSTVDSEQNLNQLKQSEENGNNFGSRVTYTEPISKQWSVIADYDYHLTKNHSLINTFNISQSGLNLNRVDSLSNDLNYLIDIHKGGVTFRKITKKLNANFGGRISYTNLTQDNLIGDTTQYQNFLNLFPAAAINYKFTTTQNLRVSYNGSTRQPTLQQINPIQDLSNPLVIYRGNAQLKQSFNHDFDLTFNTYKPISGRSLYMNLSYNFTTSDFANADQVDTKGRKIYQTINVEGNQSFGGYMYYYFKIPKYKLGISQSLNPNIYRNSNYINGLANTNTNANCTYDLTFEVEKEDLYEIRFSPSLTYNRSSSSIRKDVVTEFFTYGIYGSIELLKPKKFEWFIDAQWNIRPQTQVFTQNNNTIIIGAYVQRKLLKSENLIVKLGVDDLLNQNIGFSRTANSNYINENTHIVLRRYFMLNLTYNFNNGPKK